MSNLSNIVLIGMPGCGKTTIGEILAEKLKRDFIDVDAFIEKTEGKLIPEIFKNGEAFFREIESDVVRTVSNLNGVIISTGGGVVKRYENIEALKKSGVIIFIDRPIENIAGDVDTESRPLLNKDKNALYNLYNERYELYKTYSDIIIKNDDALDVILDKIISSVDEYIE